MKSLEKSRLDQLLVERGLAPSREKAQRLIMSGAVLVDMVPVDKAGTRIPAGSDIQVTRDETEFVSRGGLKLQAALQALELDVTGLVCMDIGASTGGFTDCLLPYETIHRALDLITVDTSFISLKLVVPAAEKFMKQGTRVLALIKPQFEAGGHRIGKGGVVRDPVVREEIVEEMKLFFEQRGYETGRVITSPVPGPKGNIEFIISLRYLNETCNT